MAIDKLQKQRFELKYIVSEHKAQAIRHYVRNFLKIDEFGATQPQFSYPVHSLYLDSQGLRTYQDTINGNRNRFKIRVRHYEDNGEKVFLEMKRRYDQVIVKKRAIIPRNKIEELIYNPFPKADYLKHHNSQQLESLQYICRFMNELGAKPRVHVSYLREAYELDGSNAVRVTFDREVKTEYVHMVKLTTQHANPVPVFNNKVILELKFTNRFPAWMNEMVQQFGLFRESAAKYVDGINEMKYKRNMA